MLTKMKLQKKSIFMFGFSIFFMLLIMGCSNSKLTEDKAKQTVDALLARGTELPDNNRKPAQLIEWQGLIEVSETEMHGKSIIQHKDGRMNGAFIFHRTSDNEWVLDKVQFRAANWNYWNEDVFQKVE